MKRCTVCKIEKNLDDFHPHPRYKYGVRAQCKECRSQLGKEYYEANKEECLSRCADYRQNNKEKRKQTCDNYRNNNKHKAREYYLHIRTTKKYKDYVKKYREKNKAIIQNMSRHREKVLYDTNPLYRIKKLIRWHIRQSIKLFTGEKLTTSSSVLGCTYAEFIIYIDNKFTDGMSWDNRHEWHLDHIVPISFAKDVDEVLKLNHYTNFRPLWAKDNLSKGNTITTESLNHPLFIEIMENRIKT
jgi:hypothetical protein